MPILEAELKAFAINAFIDKLKDWKNDAVKAIDSAPMADVANTPEIFQTAVWVNFGLGAVTKLAPVSRGMTTVADIISNHAMHIFAVDMMVTGLHTLYKNYAKDLNALLNLHYTRIKQSLIYETKLMEDIFKASDLAEKAVAQVVEVARRRIDEPIMNKLKASGYLGALILEAELLDTKENAIGTRIKAAVTSISQKIKWLYEGSKFGWGHDTLYALDYSKMDCSFADFRDPFTGRISACRPGYHVVSRGGPAPGFRNDIHETDTFNELLANVWKYDVQFKDRIGPHDVAFARMNPKAKTVMQIMEDAEESQLAGSRKRLLEVEPAVWEMITRASNGRSLSF
jgi:hypothetical protein